MLLVTDILQQLLEIVDDFELRVFSHGRRRLCCFTPYHQRLTYVSWSARTNFWICIRCFHIIFVFLWMTRVLSPPHNPWQSEQWQSPTTSEVEGVSPSQPRTQHCKPRTCSTVGTAIDGRWHEWKEGRVWQMPWRVDSRTIGTPRIVHPSLLTQWPPGSMHFLRRLARHRRHGGAHDELWDAWCRVPQVVGNPNRWL